VHTPKPKQGCFIQKRTRKNKSAPTVEESPVDASLPADGQALSAATTFAASSSHIGGATAVTGMGNDTTVTPDSRDPPGVIYGTGLDIERHDQRQNENLKRAGNKLTDRHGKQARLGSASREEAMVQQALQFPTPCLNPENPMVQVSVSSRLQGQACASAEETGTSDGTPLQASDDGESLREGTLLVLDSVLQGSQILVDTRCKLVQKCEERVREMHRLHTKAIALYDEMKRANPSTKSKAPEYRRDLVGEVSALVARASTDEFHGKCMVKAKALFDMLYKDLQNMSLLHQQLVNIVNQQESEFASRHEAFKAWKAKSKALSRESNALLRTSHQVQHRLVAVKEELADVNEKLAAIKEEESNHKMAL
jgi:hypothetical protein